MSDHHYPDVPGAADRDTARAAADDIASHVNRLQNMVIQQLSHSPQTVHECANQLGLPVSTVQPRFSELARRGRIKDSGARRVNSTSGKKAIVWEMTPC
jgi:predicted ArsR family transcriptional regulator